MKREAAVACLVVALGCERGAPASPGTRHQERATAIHKKYNAELEELRVLCAEQGKRVDGFAQYLIPVVPQGHFVPVHTVAERFDEQYRACQQQLDPEASCMPALRLEYYRELGHTYFKADVEAVFALSNQDPALNLEALLAHSHNGSMRAFAQQQREELDTFCATSKAQWNELRKVELEQSAQQSRAEESEQARRVALAVAAGLQAFGQSMQQQGAGPSVTTPAALGCSSDFQCGAGAACVKQMYASAGVCMRKVKAHGVPDYTPPEPGSVGPKMPASTDCKTLADCPVGFACQASSGACVR